MQNSLYTYLFKHEENYYIYNSEQCLLAEISLDMYKSLHDRDFGEINTDTLKVLCDKKIVVSDEDRYSYYNESKIKFLSSAYNNEVITLAIVPCTGCNFECPYCFETKKHPKIIDEKTENDIIDFINGHESAKELYLTWYGGEPLLAFDKIKSIYKKIKEKTSVEIKGNSIVTNGYLINDDVLNFFKESNLNQIQITLDGLPEHHNKTRYLKAGKKETFDTIIENIKKTAECLPQTQVAVRINVNKTNEKDFANLYKRFSEEMDYSNVYAYPGFIREDTCDNW